MPPSSSESPVSRSADDPSESAIPFVSLRFLIVDDNPDGRYLIAKTLLRKFPDSVISECQSGEAALGLLRTEKIAAIISHRTYDYEGTALVGEFRKVNTSVPIVMMSGVDQEAASLAAGASRFLLSEQWLMIGSIVAELLSNDHIARQSLE